jgi:thioester reductase-like protein
VTRRQPTEEPRLPERVLVTGYPAFTARRMTQKILAADPEARVFLLVRDKFVAAAREFQGALPQDHGRRMEVVIGDVCDMDLGLSGAEFRALCDELTSIHHLAGI